MRERKKDGVSVLTFFLLCIIRYVKKVFITDNWRNILPRYLGFLRGVVDAEEVLQKLGGERCVDHCKHRLI